MTRAQELIEKAKNKYPVSIYYTGQLSEEEITVLEKVCDVKCPSIYMNGSATYSIRYKGRTSDNGDTIMALPLVKPRQEDEYRKMIEDIKTEISVARKRQEEIAYGCNDLNERYTHLQMESAYLHCLNIIDKFTKEQEKSNQ